MYLHTLKKLLGSVAKTKRKIFLICPNTNSELVPPEKHKIYLTLRLMKALSDSKKIWKTLRGDHVHTHIHSTTKNV